MIDTGTALVYLETEVMNAWFRALDQIHPGDCDQYFFDAYPACYCDSQDDFHPLTFKLGEYILEMQPDEYVVETYDENYDTVCYFLISENVYGHGNKKVALLGDAFMRNYYIVHDMYNQ